MTKKFYTTITDNGMDELLTEDDLRKEYDDYRKENPTDDISFKAFVEDQIVNDEIMEVHLSLEEIEGLLTETQDQIELETYVPYSVFEDYEERGGENCPYDSMFFTVPYSWYLRYLEEHYDLDHLKSNHRPKPDEDLDDAFMQEYIFDDTEWMYNQAEADGVVISKTIL